jgi:signal transduction histidine kinase/ligand-binding sensor domain-containing protein
MSCSRKRALWLLFAGAFFAPLANALDSALQVSQYAHSSWKIIDGVIPGIPYGLAQTSDGYLWIGTSSGLAHFDGVRFVNFPVTETSQSVGSNAITSLFGAKDGSLWIGTRAGLSHLADGELTNLDYTGAYPAAMTESGDGGIWISNVAKGGASGGNARAPLCRVASSPMRCFSDTEGLTVGSKDFSAVGLAQDTDGSFLLGTTSSLLRWKPGGATTSFELQGAKSYGTPNVVAIARDSEGIFWVGVRQAGPHLGLMQLRKDILDSVRIGEFDGAKVVVSSLLMDTDHTLWVGTNEQGLWHINDKKRVDHYTSREGLSGDDVNRIFEDREGNVWVATTNGIDMFHALPVSSIGAREGRSGDHVDTIMARKNELWAASDNKIDIISADGVKTIDPSAGFSGDQITALFEDNSDGIWVSTDNSLYVLRGGKFVEVRRKDGRQIGWTTSMAQDADGSILAMSIRPERRMVRLRDFKVVEDALLPPTPLVQKIAAGPSGVWLGLRVGDFARYQDQEIKNIVEFEHNPESFVQHITVNSDGSVFGSTRIGLAAWKNDRKQTLTTRNGLPCDYLYTHIIDDSGDLWLFGQCGLMGISHEDIAAWWQDANRKVVVKYFDSIDGAHSGFVPFVASAKTNDGRLWFTNSAAVEVFDPNHIPSNRVLPSIRVENLVANGVVSPAKDGLVLGPLLRNLEIDYTATSLSIPQRVKFRYKLEGKDDEWMEAGSRRQAFYNDLDPGSYTFVVSASNNDGLWNDSGASFRFTVAPAWFQTTWFHIFTALLVLFLLYGGYRVRVRQIARALNIRFDERLAERTEIARDLHDTLLQTIQGSKMVADGVLLQQGDPARLRWALEKLSEWLDRAANEGRAAVDALRHSTVERNDLAQGLQRAADESPNTSQIDVSLSTVGGPIDWHPVLRNEIYRIGYEAIRNARAHAEATRLEIQLIYGKREFELRINDNGRGMDENVLNEGKPGHFGLQGMRERALRIGARLTIRSSNHGTEVRFVLPNNRIYERKNHP